MAARESFCEKMRSRREVPKSSQDFNGISQVFSSPLQTVREDFGTSRLESFCEKMRSRREVPKSSRTVCSVLLNTCEIPLKSCAPDAGVGQRFRSGWTLEIAAARDAALGTKATEVW